MRTGTARQPIVLRLRTVLPALLAGTLALALAAFPVSAYAADPGAPTASDDSAFAAAGTTTTLTLTAIDGEGDDVTFSIVTPPTGGSLGALGTPDCFSGECSVSVDYTPDAGTTTDSFTFSATDTGGHVSDPATIALTVDTPISDGLEITSAGPLTKIGISPVLNCSVNHTGDSQGEFFSDTACGTFVATGGHVYGPQSIPAGSNANDATYTPVSQVKTGSGTAADPFQIHTVVGVVAGLQVDQLDSYVVGQESYRTVTTLKNTTGTPIPAVLYKAADCYLQDSDSGFGAHDAATGSVSCVGAANGAPTSRIEQFYPLSAGSSWLEDGFSSVWAAVGTGTPLTNECAQCGNQVDNGAGLSWSVSVPANGTAARSHLTTFSPLGVAPLSATKTADASSVSVGSTDGYTITLHNPNATAATVTSVTDTLPTGFSYQVGSSTGATTTNPTVAGQQLTWSGSFPLAAGQNLTLHFSATASSTPGTYYNNAGGTATDLVVVPTGDTAPVTVTPAAVNHAPVAVADTKTTPEDTAASIAVLGNDTDSDGDALSITGTSTPGHGTVSCTTTCTYTPAANYHGPDSFTYTISDGHGGTSTGNVSITVTAVNDAPVAVTDNAPAAAGAATPVNVLGNDTDVDGDSLTVTGNGVAAHGTVTCGTSSCTYTSTAGYSGADSFTYSISDGHGGTATGTVNVTVTSSNHVPVAVADTKTTPEDTAASIAVLGNDTDSDGDALSITGTSTPGHGTVSCTTTCTYTPAANYHGPDSFTYSISDGHGGTATGNVSLTVTAVNDAPVANLDAPSTLEDTAVVVNVRANDTDVDGDALSITGSSTPGHGTVSCTTTCTYTPAANYNGPDSFTYTISDGHGGTATGNVSVTVTPVNDAPVAVNDSSTTAEDTVKAINVVANDTDPDGDTLSAILVTPPTKGGAVCSGATCTYTPNPNATGADSFTYRASDGTANSGAATVSISITAVNDAPVAINDSGGTAPGVPVTLGVLANDTDVEGDALTVTAHTAPAHGSVSCTASACTYTPAAGYSGPDAFTYTVSDGHGGVATASVAITVSANSPPNGVDDTASTPEETPKSISVLANDTDPDGDVLGVVSHTAPDGGSVTCTNTTCTYTPSLNFNGDDSFQYVVSDGRGGTDTVTVAVTVTPVNDNPLAVDDALTLDKNTTRSVAVLVNDRDVDHDALTVVSSTTPAHGTVSCTPAGACSYHGATGYTGSDSFTYTISDGHGGTDVGLVRVTVRAPATRPGAPRIGSASPGARGGTKTGIARWAAPSSNGGAPITAYIVTALRYNSRGAVVRAKSSTVGASRRSLDMALGAGNWRFRVAASNRVGRGATSRLSNRIATR